MTTRIVAALATGLFVAGLAAQDSLPPPFPRPNATKLLETDRMVVWNIVWPKGQPTALHRHTHDQVGTYYARGGRKITTPDGASREAMTEVGGLSTTRKGTTHIEEGTTDPPLRAVFIELKQDAGPQTPVPGAPIAGGKSLLDDDRVTVWDYTWASGSGGLRYHPAREAVVVFLGSGTLRVTVNGAATDVPVSAGTMRHLARGAAE